MFPQRGMRLAVASSDEPELEFSGSSRAMKIPSQAELTQLTDNMYVNKMQILFPTPKLQ